MTHRLIIGVVWATLSLFAYAEWEPYGKGSDFEVYYDPSSVMRNGDFREYLELTNYSSPQFISGTQFLSSIIRYRVNCKERSHLGLAVSFYQYQFGQKLVSQSRADFQDVWRVPKPNTANRYVLDQVCNSK